MKDFEKKSFISPDETRTFPLGKVELIKIGGLSFGKARFEPGWRWSESVKPIAKTDSCLVAHTQYVISGRLGVRMDDGSEMEFGPGEVANIPPGHDGWVVGDQPFEAIDIGLDSYAVQAKAA